ncbi:MAG: DUF1800 family protein, partial [Planctomycetota bacterium]
QGNGELRGLTEAVARDWAMLWWLDGRNSTANAPNENWAREVLELFLVGVDNGYVQNDIVELSKSFTGYQDVVLDPDTGLRQIVWNQNRHDTSQKTPFGAIIPGGGGEEEYRTAIDVIIDNLQAAEWIAYKLLEYFCYLNPPQELIDQVAAELRNQSYQFAPVLKTLFLSEAFYCQQAREGFVKSPVEYAIGFMQSLNLPILAQESGQAFLNLRLIHASLAELDQVPTQPPTVNGWPTGDLWLSAQGMVNRANVVELAISDRNDQAVAGIDVADLLPSPTATASETVDAMALRMGVTLSVSERTSLVTYLDTYTDSSGTVFFDEPFDPANPAHLAERVRGLIYIMAQHPTYMLR